MYKIAIWIFVSLCGFLLSFILGGVFGDINGGLAGLLVGFMMFIPFFSMVTLAKNRKVLPALLDFKDDEKLVFFPDKRGTLRSMVMKTRHEGILYKKGIGFIKDTGTQYYLGTIPVVFADPSLGVTIDVPAAKYTELLTEQSDTQIIDYDTAIREFLGEKDYNYFVQNYRDNPAKDAIDIQRELNFLMTAKAKDELKKEVFGIGWSFRKFADFLKYMYNPQLMDTAIETEKLWVRKEEQGYKDVDKNLGRAKLLMYALLGAAIFFAVISALDWSNFKSLFGM